jgi:hypothetical protein
MDLCFVSARRRATAAGEFRQRAPRASVTDVKRTKPPSVIGAIIVRCLINCLNEAETIKNREEGTCTRAASVRRGLRTRHVIDCQFAERGRSFVDGARGFVYDPRQTIAALLIPSLIRECINERIAKMSSKLPLP